MLLALHSLHTPEFSLILRCFISVLAKEISLIRFIPEEQHARNLHSQLAKVEVFLRGPVAMGRDKTVPRNEPIPFLLSKVLKSPVS